jgi:uncharacterized protein
MRNLTATICLTIAVLLGSAGVLVIPNTAEANFITAIINGIFRTEERSSAAATGKGFRGRSDFQKGLTAYESGDYATALRKWTPLAEHGNHAAQFSLGVMYRKGTGVPQDSKTAVKWYRLAAEQGYANAQFNLGVMYGLGEGVIKDYVYAHMWWNIAASNGNENGGKVRDLTAKEMTAAQIVEAQKLARECVAKNYKGC